MNIKRLNRIFAQAMYVMVIATLVFSATGSVYAEGPVPWLIAFPENDAVEGWEWSEGATVSLSINGITDPDWSGIANVTTWGDPRTYVRIEFGADYNLKIGDVVGLSDGIITITHTVQNLSVTEVNGDADTVSGTANINAIVQVWPHGTDYFIEDTAEDGTWIADFGALGFHEIEQTGGRSQIVIDGNATAVDWHVTYPRFTVFPEWEWFDGLDWPNGATVNITVEGKEDVCTTDGTSWNYFFNGGFPEGCDVVVGDVVTFTFGDIVRTHTVRNLAITKVNPEDNIVKGAADAGAEVHVWPHATGQEQLAITTPKGKWNVDFTGIYDIMLGDGGRSEIRDEMGNATAVDWYIPNPRLIAFPATNQIFGYGWPYGSRVNLNINGKHIAGTNVQGAPWDPNDIMAYFDFGGLHDLVAGDVVTLSGRDMEIIYTVQNLTVTEANADTNIVSGTSDPYETIYVWQHEPGPQLPFESNEDGEWLANLSGYYDIHPGSSGRSEIRDEFGNATAVDWRSPSTRFTVFPEWEYVEGWEWPDGASVYATIEGKSDCFADGTAGYGGDPVTFVQMWFPQGCDAVVGDVVTLTDNVTTRQHTIQNLAVTGANADDDTISGTADAGAQVHVWPHGYNELLPTADVDGNWTADFTETGPDLVGGMAGRTEVRDEMGNATAMEWGVPATLFVTGAEDVIANDGVCTLREAVIAAKTNAPSGEALGECPAGSEFATDTILLAANQTYSLTISGSDEYYSYTGDLDILDNSAAIDLIIMVEGGGKATISQDALVDDRVFDIHGATVYIEGLTLTGGSVSENGGGGLLNEGVLTLTDCTVSGNTASWGGGIWSWNTLIVDASIVSFNTATNYNGGGIDNAGTATIQNGSIIDQNSAPNGGGISNWENSTLIVDTSTISGNSATWGGGLRSWPGSMQTFTNSTISNNTSEHDGGGIANTGTLIIDASDMFGNSGKGGGALANWPGGQAMIQNGTLVHENSAGTGGGLFNYGGLTVVDSMVSGNSADYGGGISSWDGMVTLTNSEVSDNLALQQSGGIHNQGGGTITIENGSIVTGNSAPGGGGINNWDGTIILNDSTVTGNSATIYNGGGIGNSDTLIVEASIISNNTANSIEYSSGGGIVNSGGTVTLTNSTVSENSSYWGGGIVTWGGDLTLDASTVSDNTAINGDGGIQIKDGAIVTIQNGSAISGNTALWGGGISNWGATLTIDASTVSNNTATNGGGGILNKDGGTTTIQNGTDVSGNIAKWQGGISNWGGSILIVDGSVISGNTANDSAGGLGSSGTAFVTNSQIINNTASWTGGIGNWEESGTMIITNSTISGNSAVNDAGGIGNSGILTIETSTISGNTAGGQGGGLVNWDGTLTVTESALLGNMSNGEGDAIYSAVNILNATSITGSCIVGNGNTAVFNAASASQNFTGNWWGDTSGPFHPISNPLGSGDSVSDFIDFFGWLSDRPAFCAP